MELSFSIIGAGWIVEKVYLPFLTKFFSGYKIYLYDPNKIRTRTLREQNPNIIITSSFKEACNYSPVSIICSPNNQHYNQVMYALEINRKVICEKPLCFSHKEGEKIKTKINKNNMLFVSRPFLFRKDIIKLSQVITNEELGDVYRVNIKWLRKNGIPGSSWFSEKERSGGGVLIDLGSHVLDLLLFLLKDKIPDENFSDLKSIFINDTNKSANWHSNKNIKKNNNCFVEDNVFLFFKDKNILSTVELSWASHIPNDITLIEIYGKKGYASLETIFGFSVDTHIKSSKLIVCTSESLTQYRFNNNRIIPYFNMLKHYINVILGYESPQLSLNEIFEAIKLIEKIYSGKK